MRAEIFRLFREVADLTPAARQHYFEEHGVSKEVRTELESLLRFDLPDAPVADAVSRAAEAVLESLEETPSPGFRCGPYRLERLLGRGGMGEVFLAERDDGQVEQRVAVKLLRHGMLDSSFRFRFLRERQILAGLHHPGIARLLDVGETAGGRPYLVLDYIDGIPIDVYSRKMDLHGKLRLFLEVCDAVAYAHRNLVIHRDIKPSNILVDTAGQPKLLDFGIAKVLAVADQTRTLERRLTLDYASPEQVRGGVQGTATDVYSLGAVLYQLLTGQSPHAFSDREMESIEAAICTTDPVPARTLNKDLPSDLDFILQKTLRKEPEGRYSSVDALADDIRAFQELRPVRARSGNAWYRTRKFVARYKTAVAVTSVVIVGLALGLYAVNRQRAVAEARMAQLRALSLQVLDMDARLSSPEGASNLELHNKITATTIQYLESLRPDAIRDKRLALEIADAFLHLARIQGVPVWNQQGQYAEAEKSLRRAAELADGVIASDPTNRRALWLKVNVAHDFAIAANAQHHWDDAVTWSPKVEEGFERLARLGNLTRREINAAAYMYGDLCDIHTTVHRFQDGARYARLGIEYSRNTATIPGPRAQAFNTLSAALSAMGDLNGAEEAVRQARLQWEQLLRDEGDHRYTRLMEFQTLLAEGLLLGQGDGVNLNEPREAAKRLQSAFEIPEKFAQTAPNDLESRIMIAMAGHYLGDLLRSSDPARAHHVYEHSLMRIREVPSDVAARRIEVQLLTGSSYSARLLHRESEAREKVDGAMHLLRAIGDYPSAKLMPGGEADAALRALADADAAEGRLDQAIQRYRELRGTLLASGFDPRTDLLSAVSLTSLDSSLAALLGRSGATEEAATLRAGNREIWGHWSDHLPNNAFVQRRLADGSP